MRVGESEFGDFVPGEDQIKAAVENLAACVLEKLRDDCHDDISNFGFCLCDADAGNWFQTLAGEWRRTLFLWQ